MKSKNKVDTIKEMLKKREARRIKIVLNIPKQEAKTIKNFIDSSKIRGSAL